MDDDQAVVVRVSPLLPQRVCDLLAEALILPVQDAGQASLVQGNIPVASFRDCYERHLRVRSQLRGVPDDVPHTKAQLELRARVERVPAHYQLLVEGQRAEHPVPRDPLAYPLRRGGSAGPTRSGRQLAPPERSPRQREGVVRCAVSYLRAEVGEPGLSRQVPDDALVPRKVGEEIQEPSRVRDDLAARSVPQGHASAQIKPAERESTLHAHLERSPTTELDLQDLLYPGAP